MIAALSMATNCTVSTDGLLQAVWDGCPPRSGLDTLQSMVSRLRRRLGHEAIESVDHSYRLAVSPDQIDAVSFEHLLGEASAVLAEDPAAAATRSDEALALWRGSPFGDLGPRQWFVAETQRLHSLRVSALEIRLEADVMCGKSTTAIARLRAEIVENPYHERLWYLLVLALARDGCRVEALRACQMLRTELLEVGLEPSADIRELEQMVLTEAPSVRSQLRR